MKVNKIMHEHLETLHEEHQQPNLQQQKATTTTTTTSWNKRNLGHTSSSDGKLHIVMLKVGFM